MKKTKLPKPAIIGLIVAGLLLFAALGYFTLVGPKRSKAAELEKEIATAQATLAQYRVAALEESGREKLQVADLFRLAKAMPDVEDMPGILFELSKIARDSGITFESVRRSPLASLSGYQAVPVEIVFRGNFFEVSDFMFRLRKLVGMDSGRLTATGRLFAIDTISLTVNGSGFDSIEAKLVLDAFYYGGPAAAVAAPAPVAATPTTTTPTERTTTTTTTTLPSTTTTANPDAPPAAPSTDASAAGGTP